MKHYFQQCFTWYLWTKISFKICGTYWLEILGEGSDFSGLWGLWIIIDYICLVGWLDYSLKEINVSHLPAHELDYFVDTGFLKKERDNINHHHPSVLDIDERDMKVIQVFICHVSFVQPKFVFACLTQFDGSEQCGSESEDFFFSQQHVRIVFIPEKFYHVTKSYTDGPWR